MLDYVSAPVSRRVTSAPASQPHASAHAPETASQCQLRLVYLSGLGSCDDGVTRGGGLLRGRWCRARIGFPNPTVPVRPRGSALGILKGVSRPGLSAGDSLWNVSADLQLLENCVGPPKDCLYRLPAGYVHCSPFLADSLDTRRDQHGGRSTPHGP